MSHRITKSVFIIIAPFLVIGCIEHTFFIHIQPNGDFKMEYTASGDKMDILNSDFPIPTGTDWIISSTLDLPDIETPEYSAKRVFGNGEPVPDSFFTNDSIYPSSLIRHPLSVKYRNWWIKEIYEFSMVFNSRKVGEKYPKMAKNFEKGAGEEGWLKEVLVYLFNETLTRSITGFNREPVIRKELESWLAENVVNQLDSILLKNWAFLKRDGMDVLMQTIEPDSYSKMDSIFKVLEDEAEITMELVDDIFELSVVMPGELGISNADTTKGDTMTWIFNISNYQDDDFAMMARSSISHAGRYYFLVGLFIVALIGILLSYNRTGSAHH